MVKLSIENIILIKLKKITIIFPRKTNKRKTKQNSKGLLDLLFDKLKVAQDNSIKGVTMHVYIHFVIIVII